MVNDGIIKEIVSEFKLSGWLSYNIANDYGYKIKYRANPTIVSTDTEAFVLNSVSTVDKIYGQIYVDRVYINKNISKTEVQDLMIEMIKAFRGNVNMRELEFKNLGFEMPGYGQQYLREVAENQDIFELRFYAKGYPTV